MTDLSDINMDGVTAMSSAQELPIGQYLVRIEDTEKKETKERFDEAGNKMPPNHYLQVGLKVYGGPNDSQVEFVRLNLWNTNPTAVQMAKSELKSLQDATGVVSPNSDHFHGKWMILEIKAGIKDPTKLYRHYQAAPAEMLAAYAHIPPVPAKAPSAAAAPPFVAKQAAVAAAATAPAGSAGALPIWATKKVG